MNHKTRLFSWTLSALFFSCPAILYGGIGGTTADAQETITQHDGRMAWWRQARFGLFIHWGLYSVAAGEWDRKPAPGAGEWIMNDLQIPVSKYARLVPQFDPIKFDAHLWARLAREAGMKYIVITAKHHEGFAMFRTALSDWSIKATPFRRDPLRELAQACQEQGIKLGFYYSIMDWHHPDYAPRKPWNDLAVGPAEFDRYVAFMKGQLKELLTGYGPIGVLWFDGEWEKTWTYERGADLDAFVRSLQPQIIINNRVNTELSLEPGQRLCGDYKTPEQTIPSGGLGPSVDWETCMTMNNTWGFKKVDGDWKSAQILIRNLVDCASKGGNYLLNVGPEADGTMPEPSIHRLQQIGRWMKVNGESIWDTTASPFARPFPWGRCTKRLEAGSTTLYLHVFDWPADRELLLSGLRNPVQSVFLLGEAGTQSLTTETAENGLLINVPKTAPNLNCQADIRDSPLPVTLVVRLTGAPDIQRLAILQKRDGSITLPASEARLHGSKFQYESAGLLDDIGYWTTPEDWVDWEFKIKQPGKFSISAIIAAPASGSFEIAVAGQTLRCATPKTANYLSFARVTLGLVEIPVAGKAILTVRPIKDGWQPMNLRSIRLERLSQP